MCKHWTCTFCIFRKFFFFLFWDSNSVYWGSIHFESYRRIKRKEGFDEFDQLLTSDFGKLYYFWIFWHKFTQSSTFAQPEDNSRITECRSNKSPQQETVLFVGGHAVARCSWQREISHSANLFQFAYCSVLGSVELLNVSLATVVFFGAGSTVD